MIAAFAPAHDSPGKHDASGAFIPEARAFCKVHGAPDVRLFDNARPMAARLDQLIRVIDSLERGSVDTWAFFSHGWRDGVQFGARQSSVGILAGALKLASTPSPRVIMYCCDTGRDADEEREDDDDTGVGGTGGFADRLRFVLGRAGLTATVYAHTTTAHCTMNPFVRRFDPGEVGGGHWVIEPYSQLWQPWRRALRETNSTLRFRFPFMEQVAIEAELRGGMQ